jgi:hypothetical protein
MKEAARGGDDSGVGAGPSSQGPEERGAARMNAPIAREKDEEARLVLLMRPD